ncbi:hypothetical protein B0H14DRAFT_3424141 [Mycena olivaceomarginata]|nr:hypothetical protein B0H14DRAFT_3424141 [Mycena olivaceomarginata]
MLIHTIYHYRTGMLRRIGGRIFSNTPQQEQLPRAFGRSRRRKLDRVVELAAPVRLRRCKLDRIVELVDPVPVRMCVQCTEADMGTVAAESLT